MAKPVKTVAHKGEEYALVGFWNIKVKHTAGLTDQEVRHLAAATNNQYTVWNSCSVRRFKG